MPDVMSVIAGVQGGKTAICWEDAEMTYGELHRAVGRAALALDRDRRPWTWIGDWSKIDFVTAYLAAAVTGTPVVIGRGESAHRLVRAMRERGQTSGLASISAPEVIFSSGTTARPRGILVDGTEMFEKAAVINSFVGNNPDDVEVLTMPMSHSFGLGRLRCALVNGQTVVLGNRDRNVSSVLALGKSARRVGFGVVGSTAKILLAGSRRSLQRNADRISYVEIGSEAFEPPFRTSLRETLPESRLVLHYGMTEISRAAMVDLGAPGAVGGTVGSPMVGVEAGLGEAPPGGQPEWEGRREILLRGHAMARGTVSLESGFVPGGAWIRTGDHGRIDDDGRLFVDGRLSAVFKSMGRSVAPEATEREIAKLFPGLKAACVAGEFIPGVPVLVAVVEEGANAAMPGSLLQGLRHRLPEHQVPRRIIAVPRIPLLANGKVDRRGCADLAARLA